MPKLEEIQKLADDLQIVLDKEQQQVKNLLEQKEATNETLRNTVATLEDTIVSLQAQLADGGTPEQRQAVFDKLSALKTDLENTVEPGSEEANTNNPG
jgi:uncharacterized protein (DUF342 family)